MKTSQELMHFKSYVIDGALLRTGSANWSPTGRKRQDNDVHYEVDKTLAALFELVSKPCGIELRIEWRRPSRDREVWFSLVGAEAPEIAFRRCCCTY